MLQKKLWKISIKIGNKHKNLIKYKCNIGLALDKKAHTLRLQDAFAPCTFHNYGHSNTHSPMPLESTKANKKEKKTYKGVTSLQIFTSFPFPTTKDNLQLTRGHHLQIPSTFPNYTSISTQLNTTLLIP